LEQFLPAYTVRRRWSDRMKAFTLPLFPGYLFCRTSLEERGQVLRTNGVRGFVAFGGCPEPVPDAEMSAIMRMTSSGLPIEPLDFLRTGERVRVLDGPLRGLEGILLECGGGTRVVVSVEMLQRSVAVQIDRAALEPLTPLASRFS
jgi:transcription antitermination factor NusG